MDVIESDGDCRELKSPCLIERVGTTKLWLDVATKVGLGLRDLLFVIKCEFLCEIHGF